MARADGRRVEKCAICGAQFEGSTGRGRPRLYCSADCGELARLRAASAAVEGRIEVREHHRRTGWWWYQRRYYRERAERSRLDLGRPRLGRPAPGSCLRSGSDPGPPGGGRG